LSAPAPHPTNPVRRDVVVVFAAEATGQRQCGAVYFGATPAQAVTEILARLGRDADRVGFLPRDHGELVILDAEAAGGAQPLLRPLAQISQGLTPAELGRTLSTLRS
jgi:hypothetical protein